MRARQPAKSPPPNIVVPKERSAPALPVGLAPETRSRTPPCTIKTANVVRQPMQNHHKNDRTSPRICWLKMARLHVRQPFRTLAEPYQGVKQSAYLPLRLNRHEHEWRLTPPCGWSESAPFVRDAGRSTRCRHHCLPSPGRALLHCRRRRDNSPRQTGRTSSDNFAAGN